MVHIVIKIDDTEAAVTPQGQEAPGASVPGELLAAAAAVGAQDAGAAPAGPPTTGAVPSPPPAESGPGAQGTGDLAAGAAPGTQTEPPPSVTTEDGE